MNKYLLYLSSFMIFTAFTVSCSENDDDVDRYSVSQYQREGTKRTLDDALSIVKARRSDIATRAGQTETFSVECVISSDMFNATELQLMGAEPTDTSLFIVNAGEDDGFYVVSGDTRLPEVLCYNDKGKLSLTDESLAQTGVGTFLNLLPSYYVAQTTELPKDTPIVNIRPYKPIGIYNPYDPENRYRVYTSHTIVDSVPVLLNVSWHQGPPFNNMMEVIDGQKAPAGCVPVALAQIMTRYKMPAHIDSKYPYEWDVITGDENVLNFGWEVSKLLYDIGKGINCNYTASGSSAYIADVPSFLESIGYSCPTSVTEYQTKDVVASLKNGCPVLMGGSDSIFQTKHGWWIFSRTYTKMNAGHAWVVDGYFKKNHVTQVYDNINNSVKIIDSSYSEYLHCNWGYGKQYNGYFAAGVFDMKGKSFYGLLSGQADGYFQYGLECVNNIHPKDYE